MLLKIIKLVAFFGLSAMVSGLLSGCATLKSNCPEDPFDPNASGLCRLMYTEKEQQARINQEVAQGEQLEIQGDKLQAEEGLSVAEFKKARAAAANLRDQLSAQEKMAAEAEVRVEILQASGERTQEELDAINERLRAIQTLLQSADETKGSTPEDVGKLQLLKIELEKELNSLLDM